MALLASRRASVGSIARSRVAPAPLRLSAPARPLSQVRPASRSAREETGTGQRFSLRMAAPCSAEGRHRRSRSRREEFRAIVSSRAIPGPWGACAHACRVPARSLASAAPRVRPGRGAGQHGHRRHREGPQGAQAHLLEQAALMAQVSLLKGQGGAARAGRGWGSCCAARARLASGRARLAEISRAARRGACCCAQDLQEKWDKVENKPQVALYTVGGVFALWLTGTVIGAINNVPFVSALAMLGRELQCSCSL